MNHRKYRFLSQQNGGLRQKKYVEKLKIDCVFMPVLPSIRKEINSDLLSYLSVKFFSLSFSKSDLSEQQVQL